MGLPSAADLLMSREDRHSNRTGLYSDLSSDRLMLAALILPREQAAAELP